MWHYFRVESWSNQYKLRFAVSCCNNLVKLVILYIFYYSLFCYYVHLWWIKLINKTTADDGAIFGRSRIFLCVRHLLAGCTGLFCLFHEWTGYRVRIKRTVHVYGEQHRRTCSLQTSSIYMNVVVFSVLNAARNWSNLMAMSFAVRRVVFEPFVRTSRRLH